MDANTLHEGRVAALERSLRRNRSVVALLGLTLVVVAAGAFRPQARGPAPAEVRSRLDPSAPSSPATPLQAAEATQVQELVRTQGLVLTDELGTEVIVLRAGTDGSLVVQTPDGTEIVRLGGDPARRIGH